MVTPTDPRPGLGRAILSGSSWTAAAQVTPLLVNVVMTPYVLHAFGLPRYGVFLLATTIVAFVSSFDGGIGQSATRYFAVFAGADDKPAATRMMATLLGVVLGLGLGVVVGLFLLAGPALSLFHPPASVQAEGVVLLRALAIVLVLSQVRSLLVAPITARQLYAWPSSTSILSYGVYATGLVLSVENGWGLRGVAWTCVAQTLLAALLVLPPSLRYLDRSSVGLMPRHELTAFLRYSVSVQVTGLANIVTTQLDTFVVGRLLSVSSVSIYGTGASFALQLRSVPVNVLGPMATSVSQAFGRGGDAEAVEVFTRLQRSWVQGSTAWSATALGATYFGVSAWLGPEFRTAAVIACLLTAANMVNLWTGALTILLNAVGRPAIETRYVAVAVVVNVALTIPLVIWLGVLGTVLATALGTAIGSLYLLATARRRYDPALRSFLRDVPVTAGLAAAAAVVLAELAIRPWVPNGAVGLIFCGAAAVPGPVVFALVLLGPRAALSLGRRRLSRLTAS